MNRILKKIAPAITAIALLTACSQGSSGGGAPAGIRAIPINLNQLIQGYYPTISGTNAYVVPVASAAQNPLIGLSMFLPNGLQTPPASSSAQVVIPRLPTAPTPMLSFWLLNANLPAEPVFNPLIVSVDNLGRFVYSNNFVAESNPLFAYLVTPGARSSNGLIATSNMIANGFDGLSESNINTTFQVINLPVSGKSVAPTPFAVVGFSTSPTDIGLAFSDFVPLTGSSMISGVSPDFEACNGVVPGAGGIISAMNTFNSTQDNASFVGVGTESGAICIYNPSTESWISLTQAAVARGYTVGGSIAAIQFLNFSNNRFMYFANAAESTIPVAAAIWRATLDNNNQPSTLVNLFDTSMFSNVPDASTLLGQTLFVDPFNNVYIGSGVIPDIPDSKLKHKNKNFSSKNVAGPTPTKVYVLLAGSTVWQAVTLANDNTDPALTISIAVDGKTPVVGTFNAIESIAKAYYLSGVN